MAKVLASNLSAAAVLGQGDVSGSDPCLCPVSRSRDGPCLLEASRPCPWKLLNKGKFDDLALLRD